MAGHIVKIQLFHVYVWGVCVRVRVRVRIYRSTFEGASAISMTL